MRQHHRHAALGGALDGQAQVRGLLGLPAFRSERQRRVVALELPLLLVAHRDCVEGADVHRAAEQVLPIGLVARNRSGRLLYVWQPPRGARRRSIVRRDPGCHCSFETGFRAAATRVTSGSEGLVRPKRARKESNAMKYGCPLCRC